MSQAVKLFVQIVNRPLQLLICALRLSLRALYWVQGWKFIGWITMIIMCLNIQH
ncbi:hypothetical protein AAF463_18855 [Pantoea sp. BJ2]|uniref:Uncharacterized protein n=1 Tax=Pantoea sp. BJ2 TaxID=3141322 RepID=A0AAU7TVJ6_9GAMM